MFPLLQALVLYIHKKKNKFKIENWLATKQYKNFSALKTQ